MSGYNNPQGREYVTGLDRSTKWGGRVGDHMVAHLFDGDFGEPGKPLCRAAYDKWGGWSIWRNNVGAKGICKVCKRRADQGADGVEPAQKALSGIEDRDVVS
jgi:hypothetical protein